MRSARDRAIEIAGTICEKSGQMPKAEFARQIKEEPGKVAPYVLAMLRDITRQIEDDRQELRDSLEEIPF
jgi:hypothetical protein